MQGGADYLVAETFSEVGEAMLALEAIKKYGQGQYPLRPLPLSLSSPWKIKFSSSLSLSLSVSLSVQFLENTVFEFELSLSLRSLEK